MCIIILFFIILIFYESFIFKINNFLVLCKADSNKKLVVVKGKSPNVAAAKELIENKIQEDEKKRKELVDSNQTRSPRMKPKNPKENVIYVIMII